jgi:hypothetical protein
MFYLVSHQTLKGHILTRTAQWCCGYGGQPIAVFCLKYSFMNFHKLSFNIKKILSAINQTLLSFLERQVDYSSKYDYIEYLFEIWRVYFSPFFKVNDQTSHKPIIFRRHLSWCVKVVLESLQNILNSGLVTFEVYELIIPERLPFFKPIIRRVV